MRPSPSCTWLPLPVPLTVCGAKPAAPHFLYGFEKISFFSAGFEGAMIVLAAIAIIVTSIRERLVGLHLQNLGAGRFLILGAGAVNAVLGLYLVRTGRRLKSLIVEADGKHILVDSWTNFRGYRGVGTCPRDGLRAIRSLGGNRRRVEHPLVRRTSDLAFG